MCGRVALQLQLQLPAVHNYTVLLFLSTISVVKQTGPLFPRCWRLCFHGWLPHPRAVSNFLASAKQQCHARQQLPRVLQCCITYRIITSTITPCFKNKQKGAVFIGPKFDSCCWSTQISPVITLYFLLGMGVKFTGDGGWNYSRILANNIGVEGQNRTCLYSVSRKMQVPNFFFVYTPNNRLENISASYLPLFNSVAKKPILNSKDYERYLPSNPIKPPSYACGWTRSEIAVQVLVQ